MNDDYCVLALVRALPDSTEPFPFSSVVCAVEDLVSPRERRYERVMLMLLRGWATQSVAVEFDICEKTVRNIKRRMCAIAERDIQLARLKLWRQDVARAA